MERKKNQQTEMLIKELKKVSLESGVGLWKRIADDLEKPSRRRREVNVYSINRHAKDGEVIIVPGKVLGTGDLAKKVTIAAFNFSESAYEKIKGKGEALTIMELVKKNPKGKNVRILG